MTDQIWQRVARVVLLVALCVSGCGPPQETDGPALPPRLKRTQYYRGYFTEGFEVSAFAACFSREWPGYGEGYWLEYLPGSGFEKATELGWKVAEAKGTAGEFEAYTVYVEFTGELSPLRTSGPGYGHMGLYSREITVTRLYAYSELEAGQCK